ncbi:MAG: amidohydrolase [Euryarchaeota archaeon]|nr:amidohydrolase [Euryarchaeota archaeon]
MSDSSNDYIMIKNARILGGGSTIIIKDSKIVLVGGKELERSFVDHASMIIDLNGRFLIPGLIDSHMHFSEYAAHLDFVDLRGVRSIKDVRDKIAEIGKNLKSSDEWVIAFGWNETEFAENRILTKRDLDFDFPVIAFRRCMHVATLNDVAISKIKNSLNKMVEGGVIDLENGLLKERALEALSEIIEKIRIEKFKKNAIRAGRILRAMGLTTVSDMGISTPYLEAYWELSENLPIRVVAYISPSVLEDYDPKEIIERNSEKFIVRGVKIYIDGSLGGHTALLYEDYTDDPGNMGVLVEPVDRLIEIADRASSYGFDIAIHAIGDRAFSIALDIAEVARKNGVRVRIEHCQVIRPEDLKRAKSLGVILAVQPIFINTDSQWAIERLGRTRVKYSYLLRSLLEKGFTVAGGSDAPVEAPNPLYGIYSAVYRKSITTGETFMPEEGVSIEEAIRIYTEGSATALGIENIVGKIAPGYKAEFTILEDDPRILGEKIKDMRAFSLIL